MINLSKHAMLLGLRGSRTVATTSFLNDVRCTAPRLTRRRLLLQVCPPSPAATASTAREPHDGTRSTWGHCTQSRFSLRRLPTPSAFSGRSIPDVCTSCMIGVPAFGLPKIRTSVGRRTMPTRAAAAAWSIRARTAIPLSAAAAARRSMHALALRLLSRTVKPLGS